MDCSLPGFSAHRISQVRLLEWVAISFSRDLPNPGINPVTPALAGRFFTAEPPGKPKVKALFISPHDRTAASTDTHTPCPSFSAWKLYPNVSKKVLVQELCPQLAPAAPKFCSCATVPGLENPTQAPSVQTLYPHPLFLSLEALHPHIASQPRSPAYTQLSAQKTRPQANRSSLCPEARLQRGLPSSGRSPFRPTSPV